MTKYDDLLAADDEDRQRQAASVGNAAGRYNPDQYAKAVEVGQRLGVAAVTVANNPEAFDRPNKYSQLLDADDAPITQQWLTNFDNAAVAQDDRESLSGLERAMRLMRKGYEFNAKASQVARDMIPAFGSDFVRTPGMVLSGAGRLYEAGGRYLERGVRAIGGDTAADLLGANIEVPWWAAPSEILKRPGATIKSAGDAIDLPEERQNLATDVAGGLGQLTAQSLTLLLTGGGSSAVSLLAQGGDIMGERAEAAGATPEQTDAAVLMGASITALTERYGLDALLNRVPPQIKSRVMRQLTDAAMAGGIEAAQEAVEGVLHNLTAKAIFDPDTPLFEGIDREAVAAGGSGALARALLNAVIPGRSISFADQDHATAEQIASTVQTGKLANRSPQKLEELVSAIKAETGSEFAYVDAEAFRTLYQSDQEAAQAAAELTGSTQMYFEAAVSNTKMAIPIEKYVARIASNKETSAKLLDFVTFTPDGMTATEAKESRAEFEVRAKEIADREVTEVRPDSSQAVYDDALGQLLTTGMERSTAEKNAALTQVVFRTLGQRTGIDAQELYARYGLRVRRESMTGGTQFYQSVVETPEFRKWFGTSKVVDEAGQPLRVYHGTASDIDAFDINDLSGVNFKASEGFAFFTDKPDAYPSSASDYAEHAAGRHSGANVIPVFVKLESPLIVNADGYYNAVAAFDKQAAKIRKQVKAGGHDGVIVRYSDGSGDRLIAATRPEQIKSAIGNSGTFDPSSPSILEQRFDETRRGAIQFGADRLFTISLLEKADLSTYLHESGHLYLEILGDLAEQTDAPQQVKDDFAAVLKWMKVNDRASIGVEQHEQWARGFEAYLMEGKAPSIELQSVFARFRVWLVSVYKTLSRLNVTLTDDVRRVMDRLVATDEEIQAAEESQNYAPIFTSAEQAGMSVEEWAAYRDIATRAHEEAVTEMTDRAMKQLTREQKAWWKEERGKMLEAVTAEVNAQPIYRALALLQKGQESDGSALPEGVQPAKLNKAALVERYGKDFLKRLPRGLTAKEGINPDVAGAMFEFDSGDALVEALANARPKAQLIEMEADARMREKYGDMLTDGSLAEVAMQSAHTDGRAKVMAAELKALNRKRREVQPFVRAAEKQADREQRQAREANAATLPKGDELKVIKAAAQRIIQTKKVRDIQPNLYRMAEAKAARKAFEFASKGKFEEAYLEKRRQILNHELFRAAVAAREEVDSVVEYMRGFSKETAQARLGKAGGQYRAQINAILERFDFSNVSNIADLQRTALAEWAAEQRAKGLEVAIPDHVLNEAKRTPYKELLLVEVQGLHDAVKNIDHLSRLKNKLLAAAAKRDFDETVSETVASIDENHNRTAEVIDFAPRFGAKLKKGMKRYFAEHTKMEFLFSWLDGEKDTGPVWQALFKPVADAENVEQVKMRAARDELTKILSRYSKTELGEMFVGRVHVPEVNASFTRASLLSVALNSGNEYNREVLLRGYGWSETQLSAILAKLDNRDWDTVEAIWTHVDSYWPEIAALQKDLTGLEPEKVEAKPFTAPNGRQLPGGYYPLKYDSDTSERQSQQDEAQSVSEMFGGSFARTATKHGHTKARTDSGGKKVKLDLGVYTEHTTNVIHDLAFRRAVLDVDRLIQDDRIEKAVIETAGREMYRQLRPWLRNIAADYRQPMNTVEKVLNHARAGASIVSMGWKISTAIVQPLGYLQSIEMLGAKYAGIGLKEFYGKGTPAGMARAKEFVLERSEQMRNRMTTFDRDVRDQLKGLQDRGSKVRRSFFFLTGAMDMTVSLPTWLGAYRKAMDGAVDGIDAGNESAAIDFADSTVRKSQSAGGAKDLAGIQAGHPLFKLFTTFYSYFNVMYNLMARRIGVTKSVADIPQLAASAMTLWFLPAILSELIAQRGPGDDEDWGEWFASNWTNWGLYPLQGLIGFRELVQAMGPYGYDGPPALDAITQTGRALKIPLKAIDDEEEVGRGDVKAAVEAASYWGHLPGRQAWITGEYLYDYMTGEEVDFSLRDALFARPRD